MSNSIGKCLNIIRIRHLRKQERNIPDIVDSLGGRTSAADLLHYAEGCASDALDYHPSEDAQNVCIDCATYELSARKRRSVSKQEVCTHLARRWSATDE